MNQKQFRDLKTRLKILGNKYNVTRQCAIFFARGVIKL